MLLIVGPICGIIKWTADFCHQRDTDENLIYLSAVQLKIINQRIDGILKHLPETIVLLHSIIDLLKEIEKKITSCKCLDSYAKQYMLDVILYATQECQIAIECSKQDNSDPEQLKPILTMVNNVKNNINNNLKPGITKTFQEIEKIHITDYAKLVFTQYFKRKYSPPPFDIDSI